MREPTYQKIPFSACSPDQLRRATLGSNVITWGPDEGPAVPDFENMHRQIAAAMLRQRGF